MHIFLTGALQSGKSTAIDRYLAGCGIVPGGFRTRWDRQAGRLALHLPAAGAILTAAVMTPQGPRPDPAAFDAAARVLAAAPPAPLLLMDELGFLEGCSPLFQQTIFSLLAGSTPVLGVLRPHPASPFFEPLSHRSDIRLVVLTSDNRDQIPQLLQQLLG